METCRDWDILVCNPGKGAMYEWFGAGPKTLGSLAGLCRLGLGGCGFQIPLLVLTVVAGLSI